MKKTINKTAFVSKPVAAAVGLAMGALVAANAQAVSISNDGIGEVLLFPYYTVNNGYNTNINITNTTADTVAFKIRFRESENSRDARDFNVVLSPYDVWNASIVKTAQGGARVQTFDTSCTVGKLEPSAEFDVPGVDFTNADFSGGNKDTGREGLDRTTEGHIEVISMGRIIGGTDALVTGKSIAYNAKHVNGTPRDCDAVRDLMINKDTITTAREQFVAPINALKGSVTFQNVNSGKQITSEPTVLADFYNPASSTENLVVLPSTQAPGLHDVTPAEAYWLSDVSSTIDMEMFDAAASSQAVDAVSALLMRKSIVNQYSVNPFNEAKTDWVVTFPTKHYYVDERNPLENVVDDSSYYSTYNHLVGDDAAIAPFNTTFQQSTNGSVAACAEVGVDFVYYNREEAGAKVENPGFSPASKADSQSLCKETQVVTFNNSNLFGAHGAVGVDVAADGFNSGWMNMNFNDSAELTDGRITLDGYPVTGFSATTLENGVGSEGILNYGFSANHGYTRDETLNP
ncbi:MAG: hypothetical protein AB7S90_00945 [Marinobacterium sp.]